MYKRTHSGLGPENHDREHFTLRLVSVTQIPFSARTRTRNESVVIICKTGSGPAETRSRRVTSSVQSAFPWRVSHIVLATCLWRRVLSRYRSSQRKKRKKKMKFISPGTDISSTESSVKNRWKWPGPGCKKKTVKVFVFKFGAVKRTRLECVSLYILPTGAATSASTFTEPSSEEVCCASGEN